MILFLLFRPRLGNFHFLLQTTLRASSPLGVIALGGANLEAIGVHGISELFFKAIAAICFASLHSTINNNKNSRKYEIATQQDFLTI